MRTPNLKKSWRAITSGFLTFTILSTEIFCGISATADGTPETSVDHSVFISEIYANDIARNETYSVKDTIDLMDYIELYNDGENEIDFSNNYELHYVGKSTDVSLTVENGPVVIPAHSAAVFWIKRGDLEETISELPTKDDFRAAFDVPAEVPIYATTNQKALSNTGGTISVMKDGNVLSQITYGRFGTAGTSIHLCRNENNETLAIQEPYTAPSAGVVSEEQKVFIPAPTLEFDPYDIFISEVYANDIDRSATYSAPEIKDSTDLMDYFELYNAGDVDVPLKGNLTLGYQVKGAGDVLEFSFPEDVEPVVPAHDTAVFWMRRSEPSMDVSDFRTAFCIDDTTKIYPVSNLDALSNPGSVLQITDVKTNTVTSTVKYDTFKTTPYQGTSIHFQRKEGNASALHAWEKFSEPSPCEVNPEQLEYSEVNPVVNPDVSCSPIFISEIYSNDVDRSGSYKKGEKPISSGVDLMDYLEVYNSSDEAVNFNNNYKLVYECTDPAKLAPAKELTFTDSDVIIPANTAAIFYIRRVDIDNLDPVADEDRFRSEFGLNAEVPVYSINNQVALSNISGALSIYTKDNARVSAYEYTRLDVTVAGTSVHLRPLTAGANMVYYKQKAECTPGEVCAEQLTPYEDKGTSPELTLMDTELTSVDEGDDLVIHYTCDDPMGMRKGTLYYKTNRMDTYETIETTNFRVAQHYYAEIPGDKLLNAQSVEYYVVTENPFRTATTETCNIKINQADDFSGLRNNVSEGQTLTGMVTLTGRDKDDAPVEIQVDGTPVTTAKRLEKGAFFTLSYSGLSTGYKNAVAVGEDMLSQLTRWFITLPSKAVLVDGKYFALNSDGSAEVTVTLRAGTKGSPFEAPSSMADLDSFTATGFRLVLTDGTVLEPDNGVEPSKTYKMGSVGEELNNLDVHFTVPAEKLTASGYTWDTTTVADGAHTITLKAGDKAQTVTVNVDNTAPIITANITEGETLENERTLSFQYQDGTGVDESSLEVLLDGEILKNRIINGSDLEVGKHTLKASVCDKNGNKSEAEWHFNSQISYPMFDTLSDATEAHQAALTVSLGENVSDGDKITFHPCEVYTLNEDITVEQGWGDATGASTAGAMGTVTAPDGELPYQIYTIRTDGKAGDCLRVEVKGETNYNMPIQMYALNTTENTWDALETVKIPDGAAAEFDLAAYVNGGKVKVMAQGRGAESLPTTGKPFPNTVKNDYTWDGTGAPEQYDFSIPWITDTQYYAESYPDQYEIMNQWIADNKEKFNTKYVVHTGDLIDDFDQKWEWEYNDQFMKLLENADIPYGVLAGNHDVASGNQCYDDYWKYFGAKRFENQLGYGGSYQNNLGHYDLVSSDGVDLIFVYMSWDVYEDEVEWMNSVLKQFPDRKAILCFHNYVVASTAELDYTGLLVQRDVVAKNPNVIAVLNGHYHGSAINITKFDDDNDGTKERTVYQLCTDYQQGELGGMAYVKTLYFDVANDKVYLNSYSPSQKDFNYYNGDRLSTYDTDGLMLTKHDICEWNVDFEQDERTLTATSVSAELYKSDVISQTTVTSGTAKADYTGLSAQMSYGWYAEVENGLGLCKRSKVETFTTQKGSNKSQNSSNDNDNASVTTEQGTIVPSVTVKDGKVGATVSDFQVFTALKEVQKGGKAGVTIELSSHDNAGAVSVDVNRTAMDAISKNNASLTVETGLANITLPEVAVSELLKNGGKKITLSANKTLDGSVSIIIETNEQPVLKLPGGVQIALPVDNVEAGMVLVRVNEDGTKQVIKKSAADKNHMAALVDGSATVRIETRSSNFQDVSKDFWGRNEVTFAAAHGLFQGTAPDTFSPNSPMSRSMLVTALWRLEDETTLGTDGAFDDVDEDAWYGAAVAWAASEGVVLGDGGSFHPNGSITREQLATMLYRYAGTVGLDTETRGTLSTFRDGDRTSAWADEAMNWAVGSGLISGKDDGILDSSGTATRAEVATILCRLIGIMTNAH